MPVEPLTAPPRPELIALLDAAKDNPDDKTLRLVLADWLNEQDSPLDAERAAFIRLDIKRPRRDTSSPKARATIDALLLRWLGPVADLAQSGSFDRGLPELWSDASRFMEDDVPALLATEEFAFVQYVHIDRLYGTQLSGLAREPEFRHVAGVGSVMSSSLGSHGGPLFFSSPNLSGLRRIQLRNANPGIAGMQALANNPALARLRRLVLNDNKITDQGVAALAGSPHLPNLTHLWLSGNNIGDAGAKALAESPHLAWLRELSMRRSPRLTNRGKQALRDRFGKRAKLD
jgi:uncharacterized protein (TIGR02996 family)